MNNLRIDLQVPGSTKPISFHSTHPAIPAIGETLSISVEAKNVRKKLFYTEVHLLVTGVKHVLRIGSQRNGGNTAVLR